MMDANILRKSITRKDLTSKPIIDWSFPEAEAHLHLATPCFARDAHLDTGQTRWRVARNFIHGHPPAKVYSSWNNIDQFAKANQEGTSLPRERMIENAINNPANIPRRWIDFLSLQHSYSKFGVFRTILPTNATQKKHRTEKF